MRARATSLFDTMAAWTGWRENVAILAGMTVAFWLCVWVYAS